jgi:SET domain-containing protein
MKRKCQVFWTSNGKGWGIRASEAIPIGSFVFEFIGEILTNIEMENRLLRSLRAGKRLEMLNVALDADLEMDEEVDDTMPLYLDAMFCGNIA